MFRQEMYNFNKLKMEVIYDLKNLFNLSIYS